MKIGILDIQGSVEEHESALSKIAEVETIFVKTVDDLQNIQGLIIPGGESTTIGKLLKRFGLDLEIKKRVDSGMVVWGTCAGAILLSDLGLIDVEIERNAYGSQLNSFETGLDFDNKKIPGVFIRAPKILEVGEGVEILSKHNNHPVAVKQKNILLTTFHPELTDSMVVHEYFINMSKEKS